MQNNIQHTNTSTVPCLHPDYLQVVCWQYPLLTLDDEHMLELLAFTGVQGHQLNSILLPCIATAADCITAARSAVSDQSAEGNKLLQRTQTCVYCTVITAGMRHTSVQCAWY